MIKKSVSMIAVALLFAVSTFAQNGEPVEHHSHKKLIIEIVSIAAAGVVTGLLIEHYGRAPQIPHITSTGFTGYPAGYDPSAYNPFPTVPTAPATPGVVLVNGGHLGVGHLH